MCYDITIMYKFIRLKNVAINISHISKININKDKYTIHMNDFRSIGSILFASGDVTGYNTKIEICKINNYPDFYYISKFLDNNEIEQPLLPPRY